MHGVGAGDLAGRNDLVDIEIAVTRRRRADAHAFVGKAHMHGVRIGGRMHGDSRDPEFLASPEDAKRDLAPVGNEDFGNHGLPLTR